MSKLMSALALGALMTLTACGGNNTAGKASQVTPTQASVASSVAPASPTPSPKPTPLSREQAAAAYLKIIKPTNDQFLDQKCNAAEDFFIDGGEWPPPSHHDWPAPEKVLRACYLKWVPTMTASIKAMETTLWPLDAREDMADLISQDQAVLHCMRLGSRATTYDAMQKVFQCTPEDDGSADRVRARFGLPRRTP